MSNLTSFNINGIDASIILQASDVSLGTIKGLDSTNVQDGISELNDNIFINIVDTSNVEIINNQFVDKYGTFYDNNYASYFKINLNAERLYAFIGASIWDLPAICFYDANDNFISGYDGYLYDTTWNHFRDITLYTPANTSYALVSYYTSKGLPTIKEVGIVNSQQLYHDFDEHMNDILGSDYSTSFTDVDLTGIETYSGDYINDVGAKVTGYSYDVATDYIDVTPNTWYKYNGRFSDLRCIAEYNEHNVCIKAHKGGIINPGGYVDEYIFKL